MTTGRPHVMKRMLLTRPELPLGALLTAVGWAVMWAVVSYWNPLAFAGMWTGAALVMWGLSRNGYPGLKTHVALGALSVPLWWWFEFVNGRLQNWHYVTEFDYSTFEFGILSSIAFATVIPAVVAACSLITRLFDLGPRPARESSPSAAGPYRDRRLWRYSVAAGLVLQALVFTFPTYLYPFEWVAPFLVIDGLLAGRGGPSLIAGIRNWRHGEWRDAAGIALAGLLCGVLWEFWNFWSSPHWVYSVPGLGFLKVFEMPLLGYAGYIPFAWSVVQLVKLVSSRPRPALRYGSPRRGLPEPPL